MSRESKPPTYRKQIGKNGARAFVELGERRVYLGPYNSKESRERYTRALAEWESSGGHLSVPANQLTIVELVARFCTFCEVSLALIPSEPVANFRRSGFWIIGPTQGLAKPT